MIQQQHTWQKSTLILNKIISYKSYMYFLSVQLLITWVSVNETNILANIRLTFDRCKFYAYWMTKGKWLLIRRVVRNNTIFNGKVYHVCFKQKMR